jgi:hypothetical protein
MPLCSKESGGAWRRSDVHLVQSWYPVEEVLAGLDEAGFRDVEVTDVRGNSLAGWSVNKAFFICTKG